MGFLFRVRTASFFAGDASASVAGFYFLYKDYMLALDVVRQEVKGIDVSIGKRIEDLNQRITALENQKEAETKQQFRLI